MAKVYEKSLAQLWCGLLDLSGNWKVCVDLELLRIKNSNCLNVYTVQLFAMLMALV